MLIMTPLLDFFVHHVFIVLYLRHVLYFTPVVYQCLNRYQSISISKPPGIYLITSPSLYQNSTEPPQTPPATSAASLSNCGSLII